MKLLSAACVLAAGMILAAGHCGAQAQEYGVPLQVRVGSGNCQFQVWRYDLGGLPVWYGLPFGSPVAPAQLSQCETVSRAIEDHAAIQFAETGASVYCPANVCGSTSVSGVDGIVRDSSVLAINLILGGPAVHVTVTDQNGDPVAPSVYSWSSLGGVVTVTVDATGYLFQATSSAYAGLIEQAIASNNAGATVSGPHLWLNFVAPDSTPTSFTYTSP